MSAPLGHWLSFIPIWLIGVILFGGMLATGTLGSWLRRRHDRAARDKGEDKNSAGGQHELIVSSVMGLLALLVGFTFSLALDRHDARRMGVLKEANAIGTTYLRTQLLEAPHRNKISKTLFKYANNRLLLWDAQPGLSVEAAIAVNDRLIIELWTETVNAFPSIKRFDFSSSYLETMNEMIDMDAARRAARRATVPEEVLLLLLIYQFVTAGVVGYALVGTRGRQSAAFLFALFGLSLLVILDLNRPTSGWIRTSQQPLTEVIDMMRSNPPAAFDRGRIPSRPSNPRESR